MIKNVPYGFYWGFVVLGREKVFLGVLTKKFFFFLKKDSNYFNMIHRKKKSKRIFFYGGGNKGLSSDNVY